MDFDTFYTDEFPAMVSLARAICGDFALAEDLAQEAMTKAHRDWDRVRRYDKPGAWVRRVTINLAISRRRRVLHELKLMARIGRQPAMQETPEHDADLWEAVAKLPPRQRAAIAMFYLQDLSTASIAETLGCSVSTATSHLSQARRTLATQLEESNDDA